MSMYSKKSLTKTESKLGKDNKAYLDRIEKLEQHVRQLSEQVGHLHAELAYNSRSMRRQGNEIENMQGLVRRK